MTSEQPIIWASDRAQRNLAATATVLFSRPIATMPDSVTCHLQAELAAPDLAEQFLATRAPDLFAIGVVVGVPDGI
jgi:hypothetical protein